MRRMSSTVSARVGSFAFGVADLRGEGVRRSQVIGDGLERERLSCAKRPYPARNSLNLPVHKTWFAVQRGHPNVIRCHSYLRSERTGRGSGRAADWPASRILAIS
jgi:hypothetical protein